MLLSRWVHFNISIIKRCTKPWKREFLNFAGAASLVVTRHPSGCCHINAVPLLFQHNLQHSNNLPSFSRSLTELHVLHVFPTGHLRDCILLLRTCRGQSRHARLRPQAALPELPLALTAGPANGGHGRVWYGLWGRLPAATDDTEEERVNAWHAGANEGNVELEPRPERHPDAVDCPTG